MLPPGLDMGLDTGDILGVDRVAEAEFAMRDDAIIFHCVFPSVLMMIEKLVMNEGQGASRRL